MKSSPKFHKKSSRVALQCSIALTNAFRTLPQRSRGLLESSLKPSAVSFCTSSRGFTRTCARERTLCATSLRLSQQPARGLLESSLKPSGVPFCTSSRAFMRICARQRTSCAHSLSSLLAVLITEKFCNPSRQPILSNSLLPGGGLARRPQYNYIYTHIQYMFMASQYQHPRSISSTSSNVFF